MDQSSTKQAYTYQIKLKESLDRSTIDWFGEIVLTTLEDGKTLLVGHFADQPALRGFMDQLWNLNFTLLYLERIEDEHTE